MQTGTWADIIAEIQALAGVGTFLTTHDALLASAINRRARQAYNASQTWARYLVAGEARPGPLGVIPYTYTNTDGNRNISSATRSGFEVTVTVSADIDGDFVTGQTVTIASLTYSTANPNGAFEVTVTGDDTFTYNLADDTLTGTETYGGAGTVAPAALSDIDTFLRIHSTRPFTNLGASEYDYYTQSDGAHVMANIDGAVGFFVTYKKEWEGPYDSATNDDLPLEWFNFIAHAAYADYLRMNKQNDRAQVEEQIAADFLVLELNKPMNQFNSEVICRVSTHLSRQAR